MCWVRPLVGVRELRREVEGCGRGGRVGGGVGCQAGDRVAEILNVPIPAVVWEKPGHISSRTSIFVDPQVHAVAAASHLLRLHVLVGALPLLWPPHLFLRRVHAGDVLAHAARAGGVLAGAFQLLAAAFVAGGAAFDLRILLGLGYRRVHLLVRCLICCRAWGPRGPLVRAAVVVLLQSLCLSRKSPKAGELQGVDMNCV